MPGWNLQIFLAWRNIFILVLISPVKYNYWQKNCCFKIAWTLFSFLYWVNCLASAYYSIYFDQHTYDNVCAHDHMWTHVIIERRHLLKGLQGMEVLLATWYLATKYNFTNINKLKISSSTVFIDLCHLVPYNLANSWWSANKKAMEIQTESYLKHNSIFIGKKVYRLWQN